MAKHDSTRDQWIRDEIIETKKMYDHLRKSYDILDDKSGIDVEQLIFSGFDPHHEPNYVRVLCDMESLYPLEKKTGNGFHSGRSDLYRVMVQLWQSKKDKPLLSKEEILSIIRIC